MIKLTTNHGVISLELNAEKAPKTVATFLAYDEAGHYDNTVFHRVIKNFMIQGGGFEPVRPLLVAVSLLLSIRLLVQQLGP